MILELLFCIHVLRTYKNKSNTMTLTQGAFSFLPELSDTQIRRQVKLEFLDLWWICSDPDDQNFDWWDWLKYVYL